MSAEHKSSLDGKVKGLKGQGLVAQIDSVEQAMHELFGALCQDVETLQANTEASSCQ